MSFVPFFVTKPLVSNNFILKSMLQTFEYLMIYYYWIVSGWCALFFGICYAGSLSSRMGEHCCVGCMLRGLWPMRTAFRERHYIQVQWKCTGFSVCFRGISRLRSAFIFLRWLKLAHIYIHVRTLHSADKQGNDRQVLMNKDWRCVILRKIDFLLKICWSILCLTPLWRVRTWIHSSLSIFCLVCVFNLLTGIFTLLFWVNLICFIKKRNCHSRLFSEIAQL